MLAVMMIMFVTMTCIFTLSIGVCNVLLKDIHRGLPNVPGVIGNADAIQIQLRTSTHPTCQHQVHSQFRQPAGQTFATAGIAANDASLFNLAGLRIIFTQEQTLAFTKMWAEQIIFRGYGDTHVTILSRMNPQTQVHIISQRIMQLGKGFDLR